MFSNIIAQVRVWQASGKKEDSVKKKKKSSLLLPPPYLPYSPLALLPTLTKPTLQTFSTHPHWTNPRSIINLHLTYPTDIHNPTSPIDTIVLHHTYSPTLPYNLPPHILIKPNENPPYPSSLNLPFSLLPPTSPNLPNYPPPPTLIKPTPKPSTFHPHNICPIAFHHNPHLTYSRTFHLHQTNPKFLHHPPYNLPPPTLIKPTPKPSTFTLT